MNHKSYTSKVSFAETSLSSLLFDFHLPLAVEKKYPTTCRMNDLFELRFVQVGAIKTTSAFQLAVLAEVTLSSSRYQKCWLKDSSLRYEHGRVFFIQYEKYRLHPLKKLFRELFLNHLGDIRYSSLDDSYKLLLFFP